MKSQYKGIQILALTPPIHVTSDKTPFLSLSIFICETDGARPAVQVSRGSDNQMHVQP